MTLDVCLTFPKWEQCCFLNARPSSKQIVLSPFPRNLRFFSEDARSLKLRFRLLRKVLVIYVLD